MEFITNFEEAEKFDQLKTKILKYVLYKKRTEHEVREKFTDVDENVLEEIIEFLKEEKYIDDNDYIRRCIDEFKKLNSLSIKEITYKLSQKGINKNILDEYIYSNREDLVQYEIESAKKIIIKKSKSSDDIEEIKNFLYRKGYMTETISIAIDELN